MTNSLATKLNLSGGTMSGNIAMGSYKISGLGTPTTGSDATTKTYVDGILGSATSAAASASAASTSASNAATSEANAAAIYDSFDDRYLGPKSSNTTLDNDGNFLLTGALYFNTTSNEMRVWSGSAWVGAFSGTVSLTSGVTGTLPVANGGTNITSYAVGDLVYASTTGVLSKLADVATGNALISGGVGVAPSYGKIGLTTHVSDTLPIANGGTNTTATPTAGTVAYGTGTAIAYTTAGTTGQALLSNGSSAPTWGTAGVSAGKAIAFAMVMGF
jgi:hypothetical protein